MATLTQTPRPTSKATAEATSLLDAAFSALMRGTGGPASQFHQDAFNKDKPVLASQNAEVAAMAKGLAQLLGHKQ